MALVNDPQAFAVLLPARRHGKSAALDILAKKIPEGLTGLQPYQREIATIIFDEMWSWNDLRPIGGPLKQGPEFSFETEAFPAAKVDIYAMEGDARDPRNPNPAAGGRKFFIIKVGDRRVGGEYPTLAFAKAAAKPMHKRLVEGIVVEIQKTTPNFGRF